MKRIRVILLATLALAGCGGTTAAAVHQEDRAREQADRLISKKWAHEFVAPLGLGAGAQASEEELAQQHYETLRAEGK